MMYTVLYVDMLLSWKDLQTVQNSKEINNEILNIERKKQ